MATFTAVMAAGAAALTASPAAARGLTLSKVLPTHTDVGVEAQGGLYGYGALPALVPPPHLTQIHAPTMHALIHSSS